jgi:acyl carrier protein
MSDRTGVILDYVRHECVQEGEGREVGVDTPLISGGIVDSFAMASLRRFVESRYDIRIPDADATPAAFDSVRRIAELVERFRPAHG